MRSIIGEPLNVSEGTEWNQRSLPNVLRIRQLRDWSCLAAQPFRDHVSCPAGLHKGSPTTQTHFPPKQKTDFSLAIYNTNINQIV
jgi:hypothetical protein